MPFLPLVGFEEGNPCNRRGCQGTIIDIPPEGCCSCHISPPCSYCTTLRMHCDECDWCEEDEDMEAREIVNGKKSKHPLAGTFPKPDYSDLDRTKISWITIPSTKTTDNKIGVFPEGTTMVEVKEAINAPFGGDFFSFDPQRCKFVFIAYLTEKCD